MLLSRFPVFWRNASIVLGGTALAQLIPIAILPVLTRILPPEQLGGYFVWFGGVMVVTVVATGRFDMAVYSARTQEQIAGLLRVVLALSFIVAVVALSLAALWRYGLGHLLFEGVASEFIFSLVVCAAAMANYQMVMAVYVYKSQFRFMAISKVALAGSIASFQLLFSYLGGGLAGLVYSNLVVTLAVTFFLMVRSGGAPLTLVRGLTSTGFRQTIAENYRFPLFSMPSDFINSFSAQMPLFIIAARFGAVSVASYALVLRLLAGPVGLLANSVLAAFKDEAGSAYREYGNCVSAYRYAFRSLLILAIAPFGVLFLFGEELVIWGFGDGWEDAGRYAEILAPMFFMKFISSPLSYTLYIANKQVHDLVWQVALFVMTWAAFYLSGSLESAVTVYSAGYTLLYVIYLAISYWAAHGDAK